MNTAALPVNRHKVVQSITDQHGKTHSLELRNASLLLDGLPATVNIANADIHLVTEAGTYNVTAPALWYAFAGAGAEPTAAEAGLFLADNLMRMQQALQNMQRLQIAFQDVYEQIGGFCISPRNGVLVSGGYAKTSKYHVGATTCCWIIQRSLPLDTSKAWRA